MYLLTSGSVTGAVAGCGGKKGDGDVASFAALSGDPSGDIIAVVIGDGDEATRTPGEGVAPSGTSAAAAAAAAAAVGFALDADVNAGVDAGAEDDADDDAAKAMCCGENDIVA